MKWQKQGNTQILVANGHEAVITKSRGVYWATCFRQEVGYKIKKFTFPCRRSLRELKELVENNDIFIDTVTVPNKTRATHHTEMGTERELAYWQK